MSMEENLSNLATNINEMLGTMEKIHGKEYADKIAAMFTLTEQLKQLEEIACDACGVIVHCESMETYVRQVAVTKHAAAHIMAENIGKSINNTIDYYVTKNDWNSFKVDLKLLQDRAQHDWHSKF